ncbi:hypothetical protein EC9_52830 [Rosistilla ulvae]|uniref:Uncharacterized protein n=1 Tax=Rosistilla ulvae TaxID=1930277 RepID=A0A517M858_9BACT|nr:hypothetical protein EC9_52830 [Rosistilla ulvae]
MMWIGGEVDLDEVLQVVEVQVAAGSPKADGVVVAECFPVAWPCVAIGFHVLDAHRRDKLGRIKTGDATNRLIDIPQAEADRSDADNRQQQRAKLEPRYMLAHRLPA